MLQNLTFSDIYNLINKEFLKEIKSSNNKFISSNNLNMNIVFFNLLKKNILTIKEMDYFYEYFSKVYAISNEPLQLFLTSQCFKPLYIDYKYIDFLNNKTREYLSTNVYFEKIKNNLLYIFNTILNGKFYYLTNSDSFEKNVVSFILEEFDLEELDKMFINNFLSEIENINTLKNIDNKYLKIVNSLQEICLEIVKHIKLNKKEECYKIDKEKNEKMIPCNLINNKPDGIDEVEDNQENRLFKQNIKVISELNNVYAILKDNNINILMNKPTKKYFFDSLLIYKEDDIYKFGWVSNYKIANNINELIQMDQSNSKLDIMERFYRYCALYKIDIPSNHKF